MNNPPYIVVVDDDRQLIKLFKHTLEEGGYEVSATTSSKQVLTLIEKRRPDLLILDLNMPEPDGFDILKLVRESNPYMRMIVVSGCMEGGGAVLEATRFVGACATLPKPVKPDALLAKVRDVLGEAGKLTSKTAHPKLVAARKPR